MNGGNFFRRIFSTLLIVAIMIFGTTAHAEIYVGEGSYVMSEGENLGVAKERAKSDAMRSACEQAGVYVKSYTRVKNLALEEDVIETMTANILKLVEAPHFHPLETVDNLEGVLIRCTVKAQIDDSDITRWLDKDEQERSTLVSQMEALRRANEEQARQIAALKRQLAQSTTDEERERITNEFANEDKIFLANQKVEEGWKLYVQKDFNGALRLFGEAVQLNPDNAGAYFGRGTTYNDLRQYEQGIQDLSKALELNPNLHSNVYNNRGYAYNALRQNERAIQDFNKALELNPQNDLAYNNRGIAYQGLNQYERSIQDFNKAVELNPNNFLAYYNRGIAYFNSGQNERAIADFDRAVEINPNLAAAYNNRGWVYYCMKNYPKALQDFDKAIELDPNNTVAKNNREACLKAMSR